MDRDVNFDILLDEITNCKDISVYDISCKSSKGIVY